MIRDYYRLLNVSPNADLATIKVAFRKMAFDCHPDRGGTTREMQLVNKAWEVLSDPDRRLRYDRARARQEAKARATAEAPK